MSKTGEGVRRVAVVGATGYSGAELVTLLLRHGGVEIAGVYGSARREGERFDDVWSKFRGRVELPVRAAEAGAIAAARPDVAFLCTPHEASLALTPPLLAHGLVVIDLSAAYRLKDAGLYPTYYGFEHDDRGNLERAVYGLVEMNRAAISRADLIAVPGCYPTSSILPLSPLARAGAIRAWTRVIVDATSGVSGAGRSAEVKNLFCEVSMRAYNVLKHRHNPEIDAYSGTRTLFTAHVGPFERGILSTIHADLAPGWSEGRVREVLEGAYRGERFVRVRRAGDWPAVGDVTHTNCCDIGLAVDEGPGGAHLVITSVIDNLVKGAAGQAVQCMNVRLGMEEERGLL